MRFKAHRDAEHRVQSAITAIKVLLPLDLYPAHLREFLSIALWKVTEAHGKYRTRFRSEESLSSSEKLQHEHVFRRARLVDDLIANPSQVEEIVAKAIGCVATKSEHFRLGEVDRQFPELDGWTRYQLAGIVVLDMETGATVNLRS